MLDNGQGKWHLKECDEPVLAWITHSISGAFSWVWFFLFSLPPSLKPFWHLVPFHFLLGSPVSHPKAISASIYLSIVFKDLDFFFCFPFPADWIISQNFVPFLSYPGTCPPAPYTGRSTVTMGDSSPGLPLVNVSVTSSLRQSRKKIHARNGKYIFSLRNFILWRLREDRSKSLLDSQRIFTLKLWLGAMHSSISILAQVAHSVV